MLFIFCHLALVCIHDRHVRDEIVSAIVNHHGHRDDLHSHPGYHDLDCRVGDHHDRDDRDHHDHRDVLVYSHPCKSHVYHRDVVHHRPFVDLHIGPVTHRHVMNHHDYHFDHRFHNDLLDGYLVLVIDFDFCYLNDNCHVGHHNDGHFDDHGHLCHHIDLHLVGHHGLRGHLGLVRHHRDHRA